jgi:hypothetical protein
MRHLAVGDMWFHTRVSVDFPAQVRCSREQVLMMQSRHRGDKKEVAEELRPAGRRSHFNADCPDE